MKKLIAFIQVVLLVGIVGMTSCSEDFLTKIPPQAITQPELEDETGVEGFVVANYAWMRGSGIFAGAIGSDWVLGSMTSDEASKGSESGDQVVGNTIERWEVMSDNQYNADRWSAVYTGVNRTNDAMKFLQIVKAGKGINGAVKGTYGVNAKKDRATEIEAEIRFMRAWYHFKAAKAWKYIPYVRTPEEQDGKTADEIANPDQGWTLMEEDLTFAVNNLPDKFAGEPGRATVFAAMALLAQVHLYQNDYAAATPLLDNIINKGGFTLAPDYMDNYSEDTENNKESIFEFQASTSSTNRISLRLTQAVFPTSGPAGLGWGFYQPSQLLVDAFQVTEAGLPIQDYKARAHVKNDQDIVSGTEFTPSDALLDTRLDHTVARRGIPFMDWGVYTGSLWVRSQTNAGPYMTKKFMHFQKNNGRQNGNGAYNDRNFRMIRLAHILLWRAECYVESNELDKAMELVNQVRARAKATAPVMGLVADKKFTATGTPSVDYTKPAANYKVEPYPAGDPAFASQAAAREAVRLEMQLEFATEGMRFFDLRRWGEGTITPDYDVTRLTDYVARDADMRTFMNGATYSTKKRYWPIPQVQLDIMPALQQDPNFQ